MEINGTIRSSCDDVLYRINTPIPYSSTCKYIKTPKDIEIYRGSTVITLKDPACTNSNTAAILCLPPGACNVRVEDIIQWQQFNHGGTLLDISTNMKEQCDQHSSFKLIINEGCEDGKI